jgi:hypothetical protein
LQGAHAIAAHFGGPHWLLNDGDAKMYAQAVANVARHYQVEVAQKAIDHLNLLGMVSFIEGTRLLYSRTAQPPPQRSAQVVPLFNFAAPPAAPTPPAPPARPSHPPGGEAPGSQVFGPPMPEAPPEEALH